MLPLVIIGSSITVYSLWSKAGLVLFLLVRLVFVVLLPWLSLLCRVHWLDFDFEMFVVDRVFWVELCDICDELLLIPRPCLFEAAVVNPLLSRSGVSVVTVGYVYAMPGLFDLTRAYAYPYD